MGPSFHLHMPPGWFFQFPPDPAPLALPPPTDARTFASPFPINAELYNNVLDWKVPVTIGTLYASTAIIMNKINRDRGNKAWGFSKTRAFKWFVTAHNLFLAIFSALTFVGMIRALAHTWPAHRERTLFGKFWPGLRTENGLAGAADALCKMHGPRGFGAATYYLPLEDAWTNKNQLIHLAASGTPDPMDVGRLWNEGLAFWGWWFYLSKFYEVLDTFIILAKGKRSSTLQTYHHTGAMMCMWAGIRFMSPPIWMFAFLNSGIHTMMYIYYTLSAVGIRVPQRIKRTLTTLQISQFIIGITFAALHLFVSYSVPVKVPYTVVENITSAASSISSAASAVSTAGLAAWLKKAALRAAGEEGLAENITNEKGKLFGPEARGPALNRGETLYRTQYETIPCIDTNGQAFAIWLNLAYLAPLTGLFVRFFIRSYSRRGSAKNQTHRRKGSKSILDAAHGVSREVENLGKSAENGFGDVANGIKKVVSNNTPKSADKRRVSATIEKQYQKFEHGAEEAVSEIKDTIKRNGSVKGSPSLRRTSSQKSDKLRGMFENGEANGNRRSVDSLAQDGVKKTKQNAEAALENIKPIAEGAVERLEETAEASVKKTKEVVGMTSSWVTGEDGEFKSLAEDLSEKTKELQEEPKLETSEVPAEGSAKEDDSSSLRSNSTPSELSSEATSHKNPTEDRSRTSSSQSQQQRERSPLKSKIPQPTTTRSRSPIRKLAAANRPSSHGAKSPSPATNGTKQQIPHPPVARKSSENVLVEGGKAPSDASAKDALTPGSTEEETNGIDKQTRRSSEAKSGDGVERKGGEPEGDKPSKPTDHGKGKGKGKKRDAGLSSTDPKDDGATFAEKVAEETGEEG